MQQNGKKNCRSAKISAKSGTTAHRTALSDESEETAKAPLIGGALRLQYFG